MSKARAIGMFSGGLDSILATRLMIEVGVEVTALRCTAPFIDPIAATHRRSAYREWAARLGVPLREVDVWPEYVTLLRTPRYGFGSHLNPCIDCKIFFLRCARDIMEAEGFDFVFTGEVVGQRPMSQNRPSLRAIEKSAGLEGRLLRPLSAKLLEPTLAETSGLVDREALADISGRGRQGQMALTERFGLAGVPGAAGGCLLTDGGYSARLVDLLARREVPTRNEMYLLTVGRHLALPEGGRAIVSRNAAENEQLETLREKQAILRPVVWPGPTALLSDCLDEASIAMTAALVRRWGKPTGDGPVEIEHADGRRESLHGGHTLDESAIQAMHIR